MRPALTVVIPTHNRCDTLARTLPTILAQDVDPGSYEIIVVADGCTDETAACLAAYRHVEHLQTICQPRRGPAAARNLGVATARGEVVLFLDDDILAPPALVRSHLSAHRARKGLVTYGPVFIAPDSPPTLIAESTAAWYRTHWRRVSQQNGLRFPEDGLLAANTAIHREVLEKAGGFDPSIPSKEDNELGIRLWKRGASLHYLPDAVVHELFIKPSRDYARMDGEKWGRAEVALSRKHPEFRASSSLAGLGRSSVLKRAFRRLVLSCPVPFHRVAEPVWALAERFAPRGPVRRAGAWLLALQHRLEFLRGALREAGSYARLEREFGQRLPILLYHHVGPRSDAVPEDLSIPPEAFEAQIQWLARRGFQGIRPSDWVAWLRSGTPLPPRPILITLDDAYADCAKYALPVLERHGFGAGVFVVTREVGGTNSWDRDKGIASLPLMTAEEICHWSVRGFEFGAHSRTHADLTTLAGDRLRDELAGSAMDLAAIVGDGVGCFAYPYGFYNENVITGVRHAFDVAITCDEGINDLGTDRHLLRRTMVQPRRSFFDFTCRARFGRNPTDALRSRLMLRTRWAAATRRLRSA